MSQLFVRQVFARRHCDMVSQTRWQQQPSALKYACYINASVHHYGLCKKDHSLDQLGEYEAAQKIIATYTSSYVACTANLYFVQPAPEHASDRQEKTTAKQATTRALNYAKSVHKAQSASPNVSIPHLKSVTYIHTTHLLIDHIVQFGAVRDVHVVSMGKTNKVINFLDGFSSVCTQILIGEYEQIICIKYINNRRYNFN